MTAPVGHDCGQGEAAADGAGALEAGQRCLKEGDAAGAVVNLEEALLRPGGDCVDARLLLAEALWQETGGKGTEKALPHYERAGELAAEAGDTAKQAMVALGHGFALTHLGRAKDAVEVLSRARALAEADGNPEAVRFVERLMEQAQTLAVEGAQPLAADGQEAVRVTWRHFAEAKVSSKLAVLFMRGTLHSPLDEDSQRGVSKLRAAGCVSLEVVDVCNPGADVPEGLQAISNSIHLAFPQLFIAGVECEAWLGAELSADALRERLGAAGVELGKPHEEPCHGTGAFAEGLEPWETALVQLVSQHGAADWALLGSKLLDQGHKVPNEVGDVAEAIRVAWERLAPLVKEKLQDQPEMPCGHSCNTCPTRHDCQLHDAVGDAPRDIEDLAAGRKR
mmetsp:Transcript_53279/g.152714  ORF Transcript_53279/g.152714 Transcript_53279/m.152714 type:complete len:394 (+) Transcript_53279:136-1317(+)|eukprot:CAMPEP_0177156262 /NCGR_PEP_ID=MMETSP0367-20130122/2630_1 /TAXON_ID=447022 ORGANISM="Scrippsiella hangoei-like, Strain SHHI-4" /NCGR_SAMPLE_ID=MMETSP0367 /ASSEMBLY_ACC=CAM_ASM_000362 /LENGTH=393 /DNA_ID=CAMNT_0018601699 /DNA_START=61 /DNA_END=1242 /DNA_ORIENTATION=-